MSRAALAEVTARWDLPTRVTPPRPANRAPDQRWDGLLVCTALYLLTAVGRIHQLFPAIEIVRPALLSGLSAIGLYLADDSAERRFERVFLGPTKYVLAIAGWMTLSMTGALVLGNSFELVVNNFLKTAAMFLIVTAAVRGTRDVERLALIYLASAAVYAAVVIARFNLGADGRLGHLYYYDANDFATLAVTAVPPGLYFLRAARSTTGRALAVAALGALAVAFVRSGSRGGFVAILAVAAYMVLRYSAIALRTRIAATVLVAVVVFATASGKYWDQMGTILSDTDYNRTNESGRLQIWQRGVGYMLRYPVLGVGPGNFQTAEGTLSTFAERQQYGAGVRWNAAHNSYVQAGAELGLPGLLLFVGLLAGGFGALRQVTRRRNDGAAPREQDLAQAVTASLLGFVVGAVFLSLAYSEMLYALLALAAGSCKVAVPRLPGIRSSR